jgi:hypothetical protein
MKQLQQRLDKVLPKIESEEFLKNEGLGNEIGFYVFDYPPEYELVVREHLSFLIKKLGNRGHNFVHLNLFEVILEMLESRKLLDRAFKMQKERGDEALFNALKGPLEQNRVADFIAEKINLENCEFILLHGLGSAWPIIRGHGLLNSLHAKLGSIPLVMFYPGEYDGASLKPFGKIESNNYYRAFKLVP